MKQNPTPSSKSFQLVQFMKNEPEKPSSSQPRMPPEFCPGTLVRPSNTEAREALRGSRVPREPGPGRAGEGGSGRASDKEKAERGRAGAAKGRAGTYGQSPLPARPLLRAPETQMWTKRGPECPGSGGRGRGGGGAGAGEGRQHPLPRAGSPELARASVCASLPGAAGWNNELIRGAPDCWVGRNRSPDHFRGARRRRDARTCLAGPRGGGGKAAPDPGTRPPPAGQKLGVLSPAREKGILGPVRETMGLSGRSEGVRAARTQGLACGPGTKAPLLGPRDKGRAPVLPPARTQGPPPPRRAPTLQTNLGGGGALGPTVRINLQRRASEATGLPSKSRSRPRGSPTRAQTLTPLPGEAVPGARQSPSKVPRRAPHRLVHLHTRRHAPAHTGTHPGLTGPRVHPHMLANAAGRGPPRTASRTAGLVPVCARTTLPPHFVPNVLTF